MIDSPVMQGCTVRIVDDMGADVPGGTVGELLVRTPNTMISRGGLKIAPPMVEDALRTHPDILDAIVVPQSHPVQNQVPFAFYQLRDGAVDPGAAILTAWLQPRLESAGIPDAFERLDRWPMTDQGKVDRSRLTWMAEVGLLS
jgi:acyl-coenzyme A synthetase/AMP-(fatty) acid ligase